MAARQAFPKISLSCLGFVALLFPKLSIKLTNQGLSEHSMIIVQGEPE